MKVSNLTVLIAGLALISLSGCAHRSVVPEAFPGFASGAPTPRAHLGDLELAHFPFNSAVLTASGKLALDKDAEALKEDPKTKVQAQGYCDDRGSVQYNQALGERRAQAVKAYLVSLGVSADRISTVSFGKTHPLDARDTEQAWALNRRASFVALPNGNEVASL